MLITVNFSGYVKQSALPIGAWRACSGRSAPAEAKQQEAHPETIIWHFNIDHHDNLVAALQV